MRILLTGGTGLIGQALCQHWQRQGHELWVWSRDPHKVQRLCSGARSVQRLEELSAAQPFDAVVNLAGAPIADRPWTTARRDLLWRSRVELTRQLVDWMGQQPTAPRVLLSASAIGWYGDQGDTPLTEASPPGGKDFGSTLCMAWEQEAERASAHGVRVVRLRIAPVLAPKGGMLARLVPPFKLGLGGRLGTGQQWMPWIHLDDLVTRRRQLVDMRFQEILRMGTASKVQKKSLAAHITWLDKRITDLDDDLTTRLRASDVWRTKDDLLRGIPGVGAVTCLTMLAKCPELGQLNRREIAALTGVAPLAKDSGKHRGKRFVWGGRADVRAVLYMATVSAIRFNSSIKTFADRLKQAGKPGKVVIVACMRKLLTIMNRDFPLEDFQGG